MALPRGLPAGLLVLLALAASAAGQGMGIGNKKKDLPPAARGDVPFIKCAVCQHFVKAALREVKALREGVKPGKKLTEADIIEKLEQLCNPTRSEGEWIRNFDMVEKRDGTIELKDMGKIGKHTTETSTIARACTIASEDMDLSDLSEALYLGKTRAQLTQMACYDMSKACKDKPPPVPKDRKPGPKFEAMSDEEAQREKLMASLSASGMSGELFDRDMIKEQMKAMGADPSEYEGIGGKPKAEGLAGKLQDGVAAAKDAAAKAGEAVAGAAERARGLLKGALGKVTGSGDGEL